MSLFQSSVCIMFVAWLCAACQFTPARTDDAQLPGAPTVQPTFITFADQAETQPVYAPLIAEFQAQNPDLVVQFVPLDAAASAAPRGQQLVAAADVTVLSLFDPADGAVFADLAPLRDADATFNSQDFWPGALDACTVQGRAFGVPMLVEPQFLFYDGTAFDASGVARPLPGWTWDAFQQTARALTVRSGTTTTRYGFVPDAGSPVALLAPQVRTARNDRQPALLAALDQYVALARDGVVPPRAGPDAAQQAEALIAHGQAAIWTEPTLNLELRRARNGADVALATFPVDVAMSPDRSNPALVVCAAISAGSQHPDAAWRWISFVSTQSVSTDWRAVPARPSVADRVDHWDRVDDATRPVLRAALAQALFTRVPPQVTAALDAAFTQASAGRGDLAAALATIPFDEPPAAVPQPRAPVQVAPPVPTDAPGGTTIQYLLSGSRSMDMERQLTDAFSRDNPTVRVRVQMPANTPRTFPELAAQFDCMEQQGVISTSVDQAALQDIGPLLDADTTISLDDFDPQQLRLLRTTDGKLYGLPITALPIVIRYNADLLQQHGIPPPTSDWTVQDFERIARATTVRAGTNTVYGFAIQNGSGLEVLFALRGANVYDFATSPPTAQFAEPKVEDAARWVAMLVDDGVMPPTDGFSDATNDLIQQGRVAMWLGLADLQPETTIGPDGARSPLPFTSGTVAPPVTTVPLPVVFTRNIFITQRAGDPQPCWKWATFVSAHAEAFHGVPARRSVREGAAYTAQVGDDVAATYRTALSRPTQPGFPGYARHWFDQAMAATFAGTAPARAFATAHQRADAYAACIAASAPTDQQQDRCARQVDPTYQEPGAGP